MSGGKRIGILAALEDELAVVLDHMSECEREEHAGRTFFCGRVGDTDVVAAVCGVGKVNAATCAQVMIDRYAAGALINTGVAGGLHPEIRHLCIVIADGVAYHDVSAKQLEELFPNTSLFRADARLNARLLDAAQGEDVRVGTIATGDAFVGEGEKKRAIREAHGALCVEMEGAAIAHTAFANGVPFAVIRCISDLADDASEQDFDRFFRRASDKTAGIVCAMLAAM